MKCKLTKVLYILFYIIVLSGTGSVTDANTPNNKDIEASIQDFFKVYMDDFKCLNNNARIDETGNDNLYLFNKAHEIEITFLKEFNLGYKDLSYQITPVFKSIEGDKALVKVLLSMNYEYLKTPQLKSSMNNVAYEFELINRDGQWVIKDITSDFERFRIFSEDVSLNLIKGNGYRNGITKRQAIEQTFNKHVEEIYRSKARKLSMGERPNNKQLDGNNKNLFEHAESKTDKFIINEENNYSPLQGSVYAHAFSVCPISERIFYTAESDCTNFVSQCIWAAYGGYINNNNTVSTRNMNNKVKMTDTWFGNNGGGTAPWESVEKFYSYSIRKKQKGPIAETVNDNQPASNLLPSEIEEGDVLQFRRGDTGTYTHSVYVTANNNNGGYDGIFVCQHSTDWDNRCLEDLIMSPGWGGFTNCYMRKLSFNEANFDKKSSSNSENADEIQCINSNISEEDIEEGKKLVKRFYDSINEKDYLSYRSTLGSYRGMDTEIDKSKFMNNNIKFNIKEIGYPGKYHDMVEPPESYEKSFGKKPYGWMYVYAVVNKIQDYEGDTDKEDTIDFILVKEYEDSPWVIHDVGV